MKILFLCGSLEAGKNGVGDYTRRLAGELIRQGHDCRLVSIMDEKVSCTVQELQMSELAKILILRLPYHKGYSYNLNECSSLISYFNPDWISIQYVPFIFQAKGLPFRLSASLKPLLKGRKLHIMFHELWVGMDSGSSVKLKLWSILQRRIILNFLKRLKPDLIHTHTRLYMNKLEDLGFKSSYLPLFGNIPFVNPPINIDRLEPIYVCAKLSFVIFGSIHYGAPIESFISCLATYALKNEKVVEFQFIGRCGVFIHEWIKVCSDAGFIVNVLGELSNESISVLLSEADWGITTTPYLLVEKSGTVAAMIEHGLPVICVARSWYVKGYEYQEIPGIYVFTKQTVIDYLQAHSCISPVNTVSDISIKIINSLSEI